MTADAPGVVYRDVPGFPGYRVGSDRSVWSCLPIGCRPKHGPAKVAPWRLVSGTRDQRCQDGNPRVGLYRDGLRHFLPLTALMRAAFPEMFPDERPPAAEVLVEAFPPAPPIVPPAGAELPADDPGDDQSVAYRDLAGSPGYRVGSDRSVWSCRRGGRLTSPPRWHRLSTRQRGRGRPSVVIYRDGRPCERLVDQLYQAAFTPPHPELPSGHPAAEEHVRGSQHPLARLDELSVAEARRLKAEGWSYAALVERFGVSNGALFHAISGRTWRHVPMAAAAERGDSPP